MPENEQTTRAISILQIRPDPSQPRKLLPPDLSEELATGTSPVGILGQLRTRAEHNRWLRERLSELDALAHSIGEDGLMNPIRVFSDRDGRYTIEEGERRWWAHQILVTQGKEEFKTIAAFVVEPKGESFGLLRRRVAENVLRSEFSAIELARAMAARIQEIVAANPDTKQGAAEKQVGKENGMSDRRVRQFIALLTFSPEVQAFAQQARLSENSLRGIVGIKDSAKQLAAVRDLIHPSRMKTSPSSLSKLSARRKPERAANRHSHRRVRPAPHPEESARRNRNLRGDAKRKERRCKNMSATQTIQKLLILAKTLSTADWAYAIKRTHRRAISRLHNTLEVALGASNRRN